jgi:GNAT superfamily N-acetyltransferase
MPPFIIFGMARSRTTWLSRFLSYGDWHCGHDEIVHIRNLADVQSWFRQPNTGTVETAAAPWWRMVRKISPDARVAVVLRPVQESVDSFMRLGLPFDRDLLTTELRRQDRKLEQIARRWPGAMVVSYSDLDSEAVCAAIFEHCLPYKHDHGWWEHVSRQNIQVNMTAVVRYHQAHSVQIEKARAQAKVQSLADLRRPFREPAELVIREEPLEDFLRDVPAVARQHCTVIDEHPENYRNKNWDLMKDLEAIDAHQVVVARCNGKIFGYLMATVGPSMETPGIKVGCHTIFYASPEFNGLGRKLLHASTDLLKEKGVSEVYFRAGVRADGARLGAVFERMGAEPYGQLYKLTL